MFSYGGQNDDELCFETGDIITLISKVGCLNNRAWKYRFLLEIVTTIWLTCWWSIIYYRTKKHGGKVQHLTEELVYSLPITSSLLNVSNDTTISNDRKVGKNIYLFCRLHSCFFVLSSFFTSNVSLWANSKPNSITLNLNNTTVLFHCLLIKLFLWAFVL